MMARAAERAPGQRRAVWVLAALAVLQTACLWSDEKPPFTYAPDMRVAVPYESFSANPIFADGKTMQSPAPGTIARGHPPFAFGPGAEQAVRAGQTLELPIAPTATNLARGAHLYATFCAICHGPSGLGDGPMTGSIAPPPAYSSLPVRDYPPGRLMHVATWGTGRMSGYRGQIETDDRWRIVLHVQTLQRPREASP